MEAIQTEGNQPEEAREERPTMSVETVASTDCRDTETKSKEMKDPQKTDPAEALLPGRATPEAATHGTDQAEETLVIDSSPEKPPSERTKDDLIKSPGDDVLSIEDEEEHYEEGEVEDEEEEEDEYVEMDEDEEIYVESTDRVGMNEISDENSSDFDIDSNENTDDDIDQLEADDRKGGKDVGSEKRKASSSNEQDDDDEDVQILTDDDELEEEEDNELDEEDGEDDGDMDDTPPEDIVVVRKFGLSDSDTSGSSVEQRRNKATVHRMKRLKVKYRSFAPKLAAFLRKRSFKMLNKRNMHVMEDSSDALVVCTDVNLATNQKSALVSPKGKAEDSTVKPTSAPQEKPEPADKTCVSTTTGSTDSQSNTKEAASVAKGPGDGKRKQEIETKPEEATEKSSNDISSTTANSPPIGDNMPTATAIHVAEKIADSSDDVLSVLSSKKSFSAAATPTANSSAITEPGEGKRKESRPGSAAAADASSNEEIVSCTNEEQHGKDDTSQECSKKSCPTDNAEPTADDVMEGIDDFMEHNGSEGKEQNGDDEREFNEDLTFQMDVDEPVARNEVAHEDEDVKPGETKKGDGKAAEESAMDLTSTSEQEQQPKGNRSVEEKEMEAVSNVSMTNPDAGVVASSPMKSSQQSPSLRAASSKSELNMLDKIVVTSTPVATAPEKVPQKREERVQEEATNSQHKEAQVKHEVVDAGTNSDETDEPEAQNLSTHKPLARSSSVNRSVREERSGTADPQVVSRKRRRSMERDNAQSGADQSEVTIEPAKKLKVEVEANYPAHEQVVNEYIETTPNTSVDEIQCHTDALVKEIQTLNDMIRDTEMKWNNLLHLKKVKEEILLRLNRRKHVIGIMDTSLGEVSAFSHLDSSNLSSHSQQNHQRSSSVGPRPPTPPPEVEIRPASVSTTMNYSSNGAHPAGGDSKYAGAPNYSLISNRRNSSSTSRSGHNNNIHSSINNASSKRSAFAKDTNSFVSQFNSSNNAVTMVPLPNTTNMILHARASMNAAELAKEKETALQIQRQILPKPVLSNQQQILNNLAMSAGLTSLASGSGSRNSNTSTTVGYSELQKLQAQLQAALGVSTAILANNNLLAGITSQALLNGHHGPSVSSANSSASSREQQHQQQLQIGRQGMRKDVSSIIADYRQKHPENVPRRGRRLKNVGGSGNSCNNGGITATSTGMGSFGEGGAISLTALSGGKSPLMGSAARSSSTDSVANRISELLAAAENSRPSSNDSSQSSSNLLSSLVSASSATASSSTQQQFVKDVLVQFAKMSQNEQSLLSNLQLLANNAMLSSVGTTTSTTNIVSSPQQSPQFQQQQQQTVMQHQASLLSKTPLPEVTLHPVMNSTAHSDVLGSHGANNTLTGANLSAVNSSSNSLLHGILTKSASRPANGAAAAAAAAATVNNFNSFSPTLARLLTGPERMNAAQTSSSSSSSTVTSGALANLQTANVIGGLNLSKNNSEISITPVVGSNFQQTLLAQQQQHQQLQRLREQHLFKGESYLNIDDEADDSIDRLVIDEGDDMAHRDANSKRRGAEINENEVPQCQGCKKMEAKFVCAGCGNQWYCSRACQVNAWDDHSEVCSG